MTPFTAPDPKATLRRHLRIQRDQTSVQWADYRERLEAAAREA